MARYAIPAPFRHRTVREQGVPLHYFFRSLVADGGQRGSLSLPISAGWLLRGSGLAVMPFGNSVSLSRSNVRIAQRFNAGLR